MTNKKVHSVLFRLTKEAQHKGLGHKLTADTTNNESIE